MSPHDCNLEHYFYKRQIEKMKFCPLCGKCLQCNLLDGDFCLHPEKKEQICGK